MAEQRILDELLPGEEVLWEGRPSCYRLLRYRDIILIPFSLVWCGGVIILEILALGSQRPNSILVKLFWIPFVCIGLYMLVGRFIHMWYIRKHTWYALTSKRILILNSKNIVVLPYQKISYLDKRVNYEGRGTLYFERMEWYHLKFSPFFPMKSIAFEDVAHADIAYGIIQERMCFYS